MKVFHVITGLKNGGAEAILFRVVSDQSIRLKHEVISLSDEGFYATLLRKNGIKVTVLRISSFFSLVIVFIKLIKLIKSNKPDVVQTWMYHADIVGGLAAKLAGIKKVYWGVHNFLNPEETSFLTKFAVKIAKYLSYNVPFKIICCSEVALKSHKAIGYDADKMMVINNGFDIKKFAPDVLKRNLIRKSLNIAPDVFVLGMIARWHPVKDHATLLYALQKIKSSRFKWKCLLIGDGLNDDNQDLKSLIHKNGLQEFILCLGSRLDVSDILNALDVHILSSSSESFGNVTAEAMACSVPCIMTNVGEAKKMLTELGWVVPPADHNALADAIVQAITAMQDEMSWKKRCEDSRRAILENYSMEQMVNAYYKIWESAL